MDKTLLVEYFREKDTLRGVVVSNAKGYFGWSLCNPKDTFSKKKALDIAIARADAMKKWEKEGNAERFEKYLNSVPHSLKRSVNKMLDRADRYFKEDILEFGQIE